MHGTRPGPRRRANEVISEPPGLAEPAASIAGMDGIQATRLITAGPSTSRVLVLTTFDEYEYVCHGAARRGSGFLVMDMALEEILAAIRVAAASLIAPFIARRLIEEFAGRSQPVTGPRKIGGITGRECDVLTLIGRGLSDTEIAADLTISVAVVKTYVTRLLTKRP